MATLLLADVLLAQNTSLPAGPTSVVVAEQRLADALAQAETVVRACALAPNAVALSELLRGAVRAVLNQCGVLAPDP